jgi:hypothetical protein
VTAVVHCIQDEVLLHMQVEVLLHMLEEVLCSNVHLLAWGWDDAEDQENADLRDVHLCGEVKAVSLDGENLQKLVDGLAREEDVPIYKEGCVYQPPWTVSSFGALGLGRLTCEGDMDLSPNEEEDGDPCNCHHHVWVSKNGRAGHRGDSLLYLFLKLVEHVVVDICRESYGAPISLVKLCTMLRIYFSPETPSG